MHNPKISVIMPSYNKGEYIKLSIESILNQSMKDFELIIIDDCSSDDSIDIISSFSDKRIRFFKNEKNIGMAATRNKGVRLARGSYVALLDADDISSVYRLQHEADFLDDNPEIGIVYGECQEIDQYGRNGSLYISALHNPEYIRAMLCWKCVIPNGSTMYKKDVALSNGICYKDNMMGMDDYLFWVEMSSVTNIKGISETMLYWRNYRGNTTGKMLNDRRRKNIFAQIQRNALEINGFKLSDDEYDAYSGVMVENPHTSNSAVELDKLYAVLLNLIRQSRKMNKSTEWETVFKKLFARATEHSYIWDD